MFARRVINAAAAIRRWRPGALDALTLPSFRRLLAAEVFGDLSGNMRLAAQSWVVLELTGSALWVGLAAGVRGAVAILFGLVGGVIADRTNRRLVVVAVMGGLTGLAMTTALLAGSGELRAWHLVAMSAATGIGIAFGLPAVYSVVAGIVPATRISNALGLTAMSSNSAEMVAPAIAGALLARTSPEVVFWVIAGGYAASMLLWVRVREPQRATAPERRSIRADLAEGIAFVRRTKPLLVVAALALQQNLMAVAVMPLVPVYAKEVLDVGAGGYGLLAGAMGAGFLTGALAVSVFGNFPRKGLTMLLMGAVWDGCAVSFGFSRSLPLSMGLLFTMAVSGSYWFNAAVTLFQTRAGDAMRGRVMSVWGITMQMFPIGWLVGGALAEAFGNQQALIISALAGTPVALAFYLLSPSFRRT